MKLVELNSECNPNNQLQRNVISDEAYSKPYVLSNLDRLMDGILRKPGISDGDKWLLYNQTLQRYLNFVKAQSKSHHSSQNNNITEIIQPQENFTPLENTFNAPDDLSFNISGVMPLRDSLDSISAPNVRNFFERLRENDLSPNRITPSTSTSAAPAPAAPEPPAQSYNNNNNGRPKKKATKKTAHNYRPNEHAKTRAASKRQANSALSVLRPCKVVLKDIFWESTNAR